MHSILSCFANDWTQRSQIIKAPENASSVRLQFPGRPDTIGRFDDISLSEAPPGVYKIYKPGTAGWELCPQAEWVSDDGHSAPGSIRPMGWLLQYIEVDSMSDYILSYSIRCPSIDLRWNYYPFYIFYDKDGNQVGSGVSMKSTCTDTEWTRFTQRIYVPENATFLGIQLVEIDNDDPSYIGALYDDISLYKDSDSDDIYDDADNCPHVGNPQQINTDGDELGDACDQDDDNDGFTNLEGYEGESDPLDFCSIPKGENDRDSDGYPCGMEYDLSAVKTGQFVSFGCVP